MRSILPLLDVTHTHDLYTPCDEYKHASARRNIVKGLLRDKTFRRRDSRKNVRSDVVQKKKYNNNEDKYIPSREREKNYNLAKYNVSLKYI